MEVTDTELDLSRRNSAERGDTGKFSSVLSVGLALRLTIVNLGEEEEGRGAEESTEAAVGEALGSTTETEPT